ncbi:hypothetical protein SELMODRAFT_122862 [Selaginella moellendorffii]|uniref:Uncharacterized protein n=1 Tax=Selaginella moellendorffii TaxID=88036 RepID=D8SQH0_SELML|nr:hypothetical protein SELMODRAFT_122862 [Selaginella moellendorffii]
MRASALLFLRWRQLVLCVFGALLLLIFLSSIFPSRSRGHSSRSVELLPILGSKHGSEFLWQMPPRPARAILFLAHGCHCRATFFWDTSPNCPHCIGLPEDRLYVLKALESRYAVIAISSTNTCWDRQADTGKVVSILQGWIRENRLDGLPIFALGASSGGYFVSTLALQLRFNATVLMISEGHFEVMDFDRDYPATLFAHMPRDERRAIGVARSMKLLKEKGVGTEEIQCLALPVTPQLLSDRIPGVGDEASRKIYQALKEAGILDENDFMRSDGRRVGWRAVLERRNAFPVSLKKWEHHIQEELNAAYAYHEMTSAPLERTFDWFADHGK